MKKVRFPAFLLALTLFFSAVSIPIARAEEVDAPADWAMQEVVSALEADLIPKELQNQYAADITRQDFCTLMVQLVEKVTGKNVFAFLAEKSKTLADPFADTDDTNILAAYALGIVNGTGATTFSPDLSITRQEAAAMLQRTATALDVTGDSAELTFPDADEIASWAKESVSFVAGLTDPTTEKAVMGGSGNGFLPAEHYSRQQAFLTSLRLYHCATTKKSTGSSTGSHRDTTSIGTSTGTSTDSTTDSSASTDNSYTSADADSLLKARDFPTKKPNTVEPTQEEYKDIVYYMVCNGILSLDITWPKQYTIPEGMDAYGESMSEYFHYYFKLAKRDLPEYASFYTATGISTQYATLGDTGIISNITITLKLTLRDDLDQATLQTQIHSMEQQRDKIINDLQRQGLLNSNMTQKEMAEVFFKYTIKRLTYVNDYHASLYDILATDSAVCEGYTYLFCALCQRVGIPMRYTSGTRGGPHAWGSIVVDGVTYVCDPTWGDSKSSRYWDSTWGCNIDMSEFWVEQP